MEEREVDGMREIDGGKIKGDGHCGGGSEGNGHAAEVTVDVVVETVDR